MEGIVLQTIDYKEKSKLVYLYTPFGMESIKALDASKSKLGFITTLNVVEYEKTNSKLPTVMEYSLKKSFYSYYTHLDKMSVIVPMIDVVKHLEEEAPHYRIYPFFLECLDLIDDHNPLYILSLFLIKMLSVFGVKPRLANCVFCGRTSIVNFSIKDGGALCNFCSNENFSNQKLHHAFQMLYHKKEYGDEPILDISYKDLLEAIYSYYALHANLKLKSYKL